MQMKATEQYFPVLLFIMPRKVVLTFESVGEILKCDHANESYWAVLSCAAAYYAVQGCSNFCVCGWNMKSWSVNIQMQATGQLFPKLWPLKWKLYIEQHFSLVLFDPVYHTLEGGSNFWVCGMKPWNMKAIEYMVLFNSIFSQ